MAITNMNILFTCAGRRNYLINYFKKALGTTGKVIAIDSDLSAPALVDADIALKVPSIHSKNYISTLEKIIKKYSVNALISLNDIELPFLAANKTRLENLGTKIIISDTDTINTCFDKWETFKFFNRIGVHTPKTYLDVNLALEAINKKEISFPLVVKPRWGSASIAIDIVESEEELLLVYKLQHMKIMRSILKEVSTSTEEQCIIIQEKINGEEYGVDILNDFNGTYYDSFIRKKLSMRGGETDKAISVINTTYSDIAKKISNHTRHIGNMDCDFFVSKNKIYFLEMNPRFGGGYPFSHEAGINIPGIYIDWLRQISDVSEHNNYKEDLAFSKYDNLMPIPKSCL